jgi:adenylosuccinate synthase
VLSGFDEIPVCVGYEIDGKKHTKLPMTQTGFHHAKPVYEILPGWKTDITAARSFAELPKAAQDYVKFLEAQSGAPISAIGVGQERDATIVLRDLSQ